jgi:hypothetical protein
MVSPPGRDEYFLVNLVQLVDRSPLIAAPDHFIPTRFFFFIDFSSPFFFKGGQNSHHGREESVDCQLPVTIEAGSPIIQNRWCV